MKQQKQILALAIGLALAGAFAYFFIPDLNLLSAKGQAAIALTIVYNDGTEEVIDPSEDWTAYFSPLAIETTTGTPITSVKFEVQVKPIFTGEVESISYSGCSMFIAVDMKTKETISSAVFKGGLTSGSWNTIASGYVSASKLETWAGTDGKHQLNISPQLSIAITFSNGDILTRSASCAASWSYMREPDTPTSTFTSLSVQVNHTPLT